jgi:hypothetical protein
MEILNPYSYKVSPLRESVASIVMKGYAVIKIPIGTQAAMWHALDGINSVLPELREEFSFPDLTDGFLAIGGEHAKYTTHVDLCDRFCYWHKHRANHRQKKFAEEKIYSAIVTCEFEMHAMAQKMIAGLWDFFNGAGQVDIRDSSYLQLCMYANEHRVSDRRYLQDRHEDGHLITLIKPTRDGLVIFPDGPDAREVPVFLHDDELLVISGSLLTALSDGRIPPMYHAVKNPFVHMERKSLVYFAIPELSQAYTTLLARNRINVAELANESHRAFGNTALI